MPRPVWPFLNRHVSRYGKVFWYVRKGKGTPYIRLTAEYGTPEFQRQYEAAVYMGKIPKAPRKNANAGTLEWAIELYRQSSEWRKLSPATKKQRENIFKRMIKAGGTAPIADIERAHILAERERRAATPWAARNFLETARGLFRWALASNLIEADPTVEVKAVRKKTEGFPVWTEAEIAKFQAYWKIGTRERVAFDILLYTGLRRGDAVKLGPHHIKDGVARMDTEKTGERVYIAIEPELEATLAAGPCGTETFIFGAGGLPRVKEGFGNWFREICDEAGIKKSAHGLRKAAATRDAERGWTERELEAKYGWTGGQMASKYTRSVNRERLAVQAAERARRNNS